MNGITTKIADTYAVIGGGNTLNKVGTASQQTATIDSAISAIINGVIGLLAIICVVVIIIGGINYMTSGGDAGKVKTAKNTILYGLIGLVICVLAFAIVNWLVNIINTGA